MTFKVWIAVALTLGLAAPGGAGRAEPSSRSPAKSIAPDPDVLQGVLPNGLRYRVMSNSHPTHGVSLRLGVLAGSLDETDDEGGAAHFVEHLAYSGLGGVPEAELERTFAAQGVALGRDRNAETSYRTTTYRIDLTSSEGLGLGLRWLRHVADGGHFTEEAVTAERRVILAEREARLDASHATTVAATGFDFQGLRVGAREPIGTPQSLEAMTAAKVNAFYQRWYRPRNAVLTIVGDAPAERLRSELIRTFGGWRDEGPAPDRPPPGRVDEARGLDVLTLERPRQLQQVQVCRVRNPPSVEPDEVAALSERIRSVLWADVVQARFDRLAQDPTADVLAAHVDPETPDHWPARRTCIDATTGAAGWEPTLARIAAELARFAATGPTQDETRTAIDDRQARYRGASMQASTRASETLATALMMDGLNGRTSPSPAEAERVFDAEVADLTPADLRAAFLADWSGAGPLIVLVSPAAQDPGAIAAAWSRATAMAPATPDIPPPMATAWGYGDFGQPGLVARRQTFKAPAFSRYVFENGVVLNVLHTDVEKNHIEIAVVFGSGYRQVARADEPIASIGAALFKAQGLGRHDFQRISEIFRQQTWGADLKVGFQDFRLVGRATPGSLGHELELLAAYVSDPGFRDIDDKLRIGADYLERSYATQPTLLAAASLNDEIDPDGWEGLASLRTLGRLNSAELKRVLGPPITRSPLEIDIAGDVDEGQAVRTVGATFGALPARTHPPPDHPDATFLRFPAHPAPAPLRVTHQGPPEKAVVLAAWPLYVARPERRREEYAISLLAAIFSDRLRHRLRDAEGKTYAPSAVSQMPDFGDQGELDVTVEAGPADVDGVVDEIGRIAEDLAGGDIAAADLESVRGPRLNLIDRQAQTVAHWLDAIATSSRGPASIDQAVQERALIASITLAEVRKAAADWLKARPWVVVATPAPEPPKSAGQPP